MIIKRLGDYPVTDFQNLNARPLVMGMNIIYRSKNTDQFSGFTD